MLREVDMLGEIALVLLAAAGPTRPPCQAHPSLVGACVVVRGRLRAYNGNPTFRIWPVGTERLLGVTGAGPGEEPIMPADLGPSFQRDVFADFTVCPFTKQVRGAMQRVCIERASNRTTRDVAGASP
jgi:hypothetical protein